MNRPASISGKKCQTTHRGPDGPASGAERVEPGAISVFCKTTTVAISSFCTIPGHASLTGARYGWSLMGMWGQAIDVC